VNPTASLIQLARQIALAHQLPGDLVCAIIEQESSWNPNATRFEPAFQRRYIDKLGLDPQETKDRSTSWGLMQLMGEVARELGFKGEISTLLEPPVGIEWGCRHFANKLHEAKGDVHEALQRWNGGGNPNYAQEVENRIHKYEA
jgi:soluble lytic murein transglycosylase-like protein